MQSPGTGYAYLTDWHEPKVSTSEALKAKTTKSPSFAQGRHLAYARGADALVPTSSVPLFACLRQKSRENWLDGGCTRQLAAGKIEGSKKENK